MNLSHQNAGPIKGLEQSMVKKPTLVCDLCQCVPCPHFNADILGLKNQESQSSSVSNTSMHPSMQGKSVQEVFSQSQQQPGQPTSQQQMMQYSFFAQQ